MKKFKFSKIIVAIGMIVITYAYLHAAIIFNNTGREISSMNDYIIEGTSSFLKSNSDVFLLLNEVEIAEKQPLNYDYSYQLVVSAIEKLQTAKNYYTDAIGAGEKLSQNRKRIKKLVNFKYDEFVAENKLNVKVMDDVKLFLQNGDFIGVFKKSTKDIDDILITLHDIKEKFSRGIKPEINLFWKLLQQYTTLAQTGNYATLVFYSM